MALPTIQRKIMKWIFVSRLGRDVTEQDVKDYVKKKANSDCEVSKLTPKVAEANYSSFKVGVVETVYDSIMKPEFWPEHAFINRFYFPRQHKNFPVLGSSNAKR